MPDPEADEQEALAGALERADEAVGERRALRDDGDQEVEEVVLAQDQRPRFLGVAEQMVDHGRLRRGWQHELGVVALVPAQVVALDDRLLPGGFERTREQTILAGREDQAEGQGSERGMDVRGDEFRRPIESLGQRPEGIGAEAFGVLVLLGDRGQALARHPPVVLLELRGELGGQGIDEAAVTGGSPRSQSRRNLGTEHEHALAMPNTGHQTDPMPLLHACATMPMASVRVAAATTHKIASGLP